MKKCIPKEIVQKLRKSLENGEIDTNAIAEMLPEQKLALKAILEGVVSEGLGIKVSSEEISKISEISKKIDKAQVKLGNDLGIPSKSQENIEFFIAKKEMDDYLMSRSPASNLKVTTGTIGRGMMLFSLKSPILNIGSNIEIGFAEALSRRIAGGGIKLTDNKLAVDFVKMTNKIYQKTGYDISRMTSLTDTGSGGSRVLGEIVHAQGPGLVRKAARIMEDVVFKQLMGAPDVAFSSAHFADSVNLNARRFAKGAKAREIMLDSMRLEPTTPKGLILRQQGILDAQKATWTDKSWASTFSLGVRKIINDLSGDLRFGDFWLPFIKTSANWIATGMDYGGVGIPKALVKTYKALRTGELGSKETMSGISRDLVRAGLGLVGATLIVSKLDDDDFVGAYDPQRSQIEQLRNSNYNAFRIKGKWISTEWLGPLSVSVSAMMYARKYGKTPGERRFQYAKGVFSSFLRIPGVEDVYDLAQANAYKKNQQLEEMKGETVNYISSEVYSRLIPSFFSDVSKAVDPKLRVSKKGIEKIKTKIPGLSTTLPVKTDIFGEERIGEPAWSDILFGSRVKTDKEDDLVKEIFKISDSVGKGISFTDWDRTTGKKLAQFKEVEGIKTYNKAKIEYGKELKSLLIELVSDSDYKDMSDEEKLDAIRKQDTIATQTIFDDYSFEYETEK